MCIYVALPVNFDTDPIGSGNFLCSTKIDGQDVEIDKLSIRFFDTHTPCIYISIYIHQYIYISINIYFEICRI